MFTKCSALAVALLLASCQPGSPEPVKGVRLPITGGQTASECQWPTTVLLSGCSGTLVHPLIVTTAAHCGTNHKTAIFGEVNTRAARRVPIEYCRTFKAARGDGGATPPTGRTLTDWAFCKLAQPVNDVPIVPILMGCETEILKPGQKVVVAGFGSTEANQGGFGTKRWVETTVNKVDTGRGIQVGGMGKAPCFGDSGGPAFVKLADGTWRVFGVDSSGLGNSCAAGDLMALIHKGVPWIEQTSGIDITPCHDADGKWNPGPGCTGFSMAPDSPGRTWADGCHEPMLSPPSLTCAAGTGDGGTLPIVADATAPDVTPAGTTRPAPDATVADTAAPPPPDSAAPAPGHGTEVPPTPRADAAAAAPVVTPGGCGCRLGGPAPSRAALLVLAVLAWRLRRRRSR
jgi:MYXO-CTERM domain-containing protein